MIRSTPSRTNAPTCRGSSSRAARYQPSALSRLSSLRVWPAVCWTPIPREQRVSAHDSCWAASALTLSSLAPRGESGRGGDCEGAASGATGKGSGGARLGVGPGYGLMELVVVRILEASLLLELSQLALQRTELILAEPGGLRGLEEGHRELPGIPVVVHMSGAGAVFEGGRGVVLSSRWSQGTSMLRRSWPRCVPSSGSGSPASAP